MVDVPILRANGNFAHFDAALQPNGSVAVPTTTTPSNTTFTINLANGEWMKLEAYNPGTGLISLVVDVV